MAEIGGVRTGSGTGTGTADRLYYSLMILEPGDTLVVVDVQRDFFPGGALAVPGGEQVVPALRRAIALFREADLPVVFTRDWHPPDHCSFRDHGGPWPVHCVAGTQGAQFHPDLPLVPGAEIISKGSSRHQDAYSGFQGTALAVRLRGWGVRRVLVGGLATDYCVKSTVQDALKEGFAAVVLIDAVRAVDLQPGDGDRALEELQRAGALEIRSEDLRCADR